MAFAFYGGDIRPDIPGHSRRYCGADGVNSAPEGIDIQMRITLRRRRLAVSKQFPDDGKPKGCPGADAGEAVAEIVDPNAIKASGALDAAPRIIKVCAWGSWVLARDNIGIAIYARDGGDDGLRSGAEINRLLPGFRVAQKEYPAL